MIRIGFGYDIHQLVPGRPLILGGVHIPYEKGLLGHSDADVLTHAIADAMLGGLALGDIGQHFPDTSDKFKGADSLKILQAVYALVRGREYRIGNIDTTVVAQAPKLAPHINMMRQNIANILDLKTGDVSIKATTNEQVGPEGRGEAISTHAVVLLHPFHLSSN